VTFGATAAFYRAEYDLTREPETPIDLPALWDEAEDFDVQAPLRPVLTVVVKVLTVVVNEFDREWGVAHVYDSEELSEDG
jgi:hypothetical protein